MSIKQKGFLFTILSALCFATGGILLKCNTWSSLSVSGFRGIFSLIIFVIYMKVKKHPMQWSFNVFLGAVANTLMSITFVMANRMTTAANAIVLQFTMPIYIILLLWIFEKKKPNLTSIVTTCCSMIGICFFFFDELTSTGLIGNILAMASGFFYAIVFLIKRMPKADFESSAVIAFGINVLIGIPFFLQESNFGIPNILTGILLGAVQIGLAYIFLNAALDQVSPFTVAITSMIEPIVNPLLVAVFYGEMISGISTIGAVIVLLSAFCYNAFSKDA